MYARYIPPPKGADPTAPKPEVEGPPSSPVASLATPYARYVPPARPAYHTTGTPTPAPRAPPTSKTHLNAAAIPPPEAVPAKIVFNYDDEPSPSKKRKIDISEPAPEPTPQPKEKKSKKDKKDKKDKSGEEKEKKKEKKQRDNKDETQEEADEDKHERRKRKKKAEQQPFTFGFDENVTMPDVSSPAAEKPRLQAANTEDDIDGSKKEAKTEDSHQKKDKKKGKSTDDVTSRHKAVLEKAAKSLQEASKTRAEERDEADEDEAEPVEVHGLEPLPQPEPINQDGLKPTYETLPAWIANPIRVTPETKASFTDLGISKEATTKLELKGYHNAFAVQTAVIPLLLPSPDRQGDVVVSAATGSGKTLAYVLPMIRDISQGVITKLRGVVVVPTRELVLQAKEVCEACANAFSGPGKKTVRIGISMGNKQFEQEQADLIEEDQRFNPEGYQKWLRDHLDQDLEVSLFDESPKPLPDHVIEYISKVDILICTPGRLVDHINRTKGFTLEYVRWVVVDEADKLLAQTFQDWLPVVMPLLASTNKPGARDFPDSNKSGVRKVILSATMTRDISLLNGLKLSRPKLIILEGANEQDGHTRESKTEHVLPELLEESAIKIRDPNLKPLYLVDLLHSSHFAPVNTADEDVEMKDAEDDDSSSSEAESESDSSDSDSSSSSEESSSEESGSESEESNDSEASPSRKRKSSSSTSKRTPFRTTVLVFTKSNETAVRLSRLLSLLSPDLSSLIGTLTSTTRTSERRKTLRAFSAHKLRILVASDLVARGIDLTNLDHVVNYDMPTSVASYVHRVGRTARAGRKGQAWTLFTKTEAGWFWTAIAGKGESKSQNAAGAGQVKRTTKVAEVRINDRWEEDIVAEFEGTLEKLGKEASEMRKKR